MLKEAERLVEIEAELRAYLALYQADEHPQRVAELREIALDAMLALEQFNPYLTGPVLKGIAGPYAEIELQLFPDSVKEVEIFLLDRNLAYETREGRRYAGDRAHAVSVLTLTWRGVPLRLSILDARDERLALWDAVGIEPYSTEREDGSWLLAGWMPADETSATKPGVEFTGIPRFAPEHFARVVLLDPMKRKQLDAGLRQLTEEGAAQVFFTSATETVSPTPIVGAVGQLQFDVMLHRLEHEYGVRTRLERISGRYPRWVVGPIEEIERVARERGRLLLYDVKGNPLLLFEDQWGMRWVLDRETGLQFFDVAP